MRGRREAPGLRPRGIAPQMQEAPFAFTTPPGLAHPAARVHVRLLGPCFKTGRRGHRPTRDRRTDRDSKRSLAIRVRHVRKKPAGPRARHGGLATAQEATTNFTSALGLVSPATRRARRGRRSATADRARSTNRVLADPGPEGDAAVGLNLRP